MARKRIIIELTRDDWEEIFYALEEKAKRIENGELGPEESEGEDEDWVEHLKGIMAQINRKLEGQPEENESEEESS